MSVRALMLSFFEAPPGQVEFTTVGTHNWVVPEGVSSISMVAVQPGGTTNATTVTYSAAVVCRAQNGARIGDGGGDGGFGGNPGADYQFETWYYAGGGGGGAGGYSGDGGDGGSGSGLHPNSGGPADANSGAAAGGQSGGGNSAGLGGGGVGLRGRGATGTASGQAGSGGSGQGGAGAGNAEYGGEYGGGSGTDPYNPGNRGGALAWKNAIPVTPGTTVTIVIPSPQFKCGRGAVRILWGDGRFYPSTNTGDA